MSELPKGKPRHTRKEIVVPIISTNLDTGVKIKTYMTTIGRSTICQ